MSICSYVIVALGSQMYYVNAWLKICLFNLALNWESVFEPWTLPGSLFQSQMHKKNALPPLVAILDTTKCPKFYELKEHGGL